MVNRIVCRRSVATVLLSVAFGMTLADEPPVDPMTGLSMAEDWELVRNNCSACHSTKLITQQRGTAAQWLGKKPPRHCAGQRR